MASTAVQKPQVNIAASYAVLDDLMRLVVRAFYSEEQVLATEILLRVHRPISDDEIAAFLKLHFRQIRRALSKLKEDQLVNSIDKKDKDKSNKDREEKERKWNQLTFWYIDYKHMVDVVKYRIYMMTKQLGSDLDKQLECQDYHCPTCRKEYTAFDAQKLIDFETGTFRCERCKSELQEKDNSSQVGTSQKKQAEMLTQLRRITDQLKKVESIIIPVLDLKIIKPEEGGETTTTSNRPMYEPTVVVDMGEKSDKAKNEATQAIFVKTDTTKVTPPWLRGSEQKKPETAEEISVQANAESNSTANKDEDKNYANMYLLSKLQNQQAAAAEVPQEEAVVDEAMEEADEEEETVQVGDRMIPISKVTGDDEAQMTKEEYEAYYQKMVDLGYVQ